MKKFVLKVEKRTVLGKKIKKLRREGILPANIYGKAMESLAVQLPYKEFEAVYKETGETGLVDVQVEGKTRPVLIHNVQIDRMTRLPLHADFFQVNLKEKVKTMVPLVITGEPKAVTENIGLLMQPISEVEVEALPADLPENIEVNVEALANIDEQIVVSDLKVPAAVTILTDAGQVVVKIAELVSKEAEAEAQADAEAAEAEKAEGEAESAENAEAVEGQEKDAEEEKAEAEKTA